MIHVHQVSQHTPLSAPWLTPISFHLKPGQFATIQGDKASGKTLLFRLMIGLDPCDSGHITLSGSRLSSNPLLNYPMRRPLGLIPQQPFIEPKLTLQANIALALLGSHLTQKQISQRTDSVLEKLLLRNCEKIMGNELTPNQIQHVHIARALINTPSAIIADEPFSHLSTEQTHHIMMLFQAFSRANVSVLILSRKQLISPSGQAYRLEKGNLIPTTTCDV